MFPAGNVVGDKRINQLNNLFCQECEALIMAFGSMRRMGRRLLSRRHPEVRYLVLVRVNIPAITEMMHDLAITFSLSPSDWRMPHITLFGPFTLAEQGTVIDVLDCIKQASEKIHDDTFALGEMMRLQGRKGKAIVRRVMFPADIGEAYQEISSCLLPLAGSCTWLDRQPERRVVHITLAFNLASPLANRIQEYLMQPGSRREAGTPAEICSEVPEGYHVAGIAVLRNGMLWKEYDLAERTWRERKELYPFFK
jgi:hypothetical protein